jgi:hydroxyacylglutathione hydrolase
MNLRFALAVEPGNPALRERVARVAALRAAGRPSVPSTLGEEKATNPFLRCTEADVIAAANQQNATVSSKKTAIFKFIREWRNNF